MKEIKDPKIDIEKIIVSVDDELIDVLKAIKETPASRILLTFPEPSDILISPINLKVVLDTADELGLPLIGLIVQNPTGIRNAKDAGMTVTETSGSILDSFWEEAEGNMKKRVNEKEESLKKRKPKAKEAVEEEVVAEGAMHPEDVEKALGEKSEFQKRVEEALDKSKAEISQKQKIVEQDGVQIGIDQDVATGGEDQQSMIGKSFKSGPLPKRKWFKFPKISIPKVNVPKAKAPSNAKGIILKIVLPIVFVLSGSLWAAYYLLPLVKINLYVESKPVSIEKTFTGNPTILAFDAEKLLVPVKKEELTQSSSGSTTATGTAYKGTKAQGILTFVYWTFQGTKTPITLPAGTKVTSSKGMSFTTNSEATIGELIGNVPKLGSEYKSIPVTAISVGEEYNLIKGDFFTVSGHASTEISAQNPEDLTGGVKTPYTILSKADVDKVTDSLKKTMFEAMTAEMNDKAIEGWAIVDKSIVKALDGDVQTDVPIGAEADTVNITVKTKVTSLFYQKGQIENAITQMLIDKANEQKLFEDTNSELSLAENIEKTIEITELKKENIKVSVKASSWIRPEISKEALTNEIKGKGWNEGIAIISSKEFSAQEPSVTFEPASFPAWLRYFPSRQGRIYITIEDIDTTPQNETSE